MGDWIRRVDETGEFAGWWRDRVTTGDYELAWKMRHHPAPQVLTFSLRPVSMPGWEAHLDHRLVNGRVKLAGVRIEAADDDADPTPIYKAVGGRKLEQQIGRELQQDMIRRNLPMAWQEATLVKRRVGRRPVTDHELARVAEAYVQACEDDPKAPMPLLASREHRSIDTLQGLKREAKRRGFLVMNGQGKSGGYLTDVAKALLEDPPKEIPHGER